MNYIETECSLPLPEHSQKFHNSFRDTDKFFPHEIIFQVAWYWSFIFLFFLFISRLDFYEKRRGEEKVSRSHFSFLLDKLSQQRCSWEISDRNKRTVSGLLFLSCFTFPTAWQKASLCFTVPWNCVFALEGFGGYRASEDTLMVCSGLGLHSVPQLEPVLVGMTGEHPGGCSPIPSPGASFLLCCSTEWKGDGKQQQLLNQKNL